MIKMSLKQIVCLSLLTLALFCLSCQDKLDLMADYKDITISYAILNKNDPVHYFKIYRGYQTEDNALIEASKWENIYYPVDSIEVRLEEYNERGQQIRSAVLDTTSVVDKSSGYFANPRQQLYYSTWELNDHYKYRLVIKHLNSGEEIYAETLIVGDCSIDLPYDQNPFSCQRDFAPTFRIISADDSRMMRELNVAICDMYIVFHYIEVDNETKKVEHKTATKKMNASYRMPQSDGTIKFDSFTARDLLLAIKENIRPKEGVTRYVDTVDGKPFFCIEVQAWFATKDFQTYHNVAMPTTSIIQDRLEYTNFISPDNNAYGLLASRNSCSKSYKFDNTGEKHNEDSLVNGSITKGLNFDYYRKSPEFFTITEK